MSDDPVLTTLTAILRRLDSMENGQTELRSDMTSLRSDMTGLRSDVTGEMTSLRSDMNTLKSDMAGLRAEMRAFRGGMMDELGATRAAIMERIDRLQNALDLVKDDITVNYGSDARAERVAKSASDETRALGDIVRAMQRQIMRLRTDLDNLRDGRSS